MSARLTRVTTGTVLCLVLAGCGSRLDGSAILAESSGAGTVRLSDDSIAALRGAADDPGAPLASEAPDFTAQCLNAQKAGVDQLLLALDGASMGRVARSCAAVGFQPLISTIALAPSNAQARDTALRSFGVATANSTAPWTENDTPGLDGGHRRARDDQAGDARWTHRPLTFTPGQKHATSNGCVFYQLLGPEGWTAPRGSRPICRLT